MQLEIQIASVRDREELVAEIWFGDVIIAEVVKHEQDFTVEFFESKLPISLEEFQVALNKAKLELSS